MRYHIGTGQPTEEAGKDQKQSLRRLKQHILVWLNAALPGRCITNFTTDWNDGITLSALVDYCKPGLVPNLTTLDPNNGLHNLRNAMGLAEKHLSIPQVMQPEDLAVSKPDELSVITYLTYFCGPNSPGQRSLLLWIQKQVPNQKVSNFTTDWLSGQALGALVNALTGGDFQRYKQMGTEQFVDNCQESMNAAEQLLEVKKTISAKDFADPDLDELVRAGYLAQFCHTKMKLALLPAAANKVDVSYLQIPEEVGPGRVVWLELDCSRAGYGVVRAEASGILTGITHVDIKQTDNAKYQVKFQPENVDIYTLAIFYGEDHIRGSPFTINLHPSDSTKVSHLHTLTPQEANQDVGLAFDVSKAGRGELTAECSGEFGGAIPIRIEPQPDGTFAVLFKPPHPDIYKVDVNWGTFSAQAVGSLVGPIPINVDQHIERDYTISFKPPHPDVYKVDVNWGGKPVPGSPFTINLLPPAQPDKVECAEPIYTGPGEIVELLVDISNAGSGTLTAQGGGKKYGDVEIYINKVTRTAYQVSFIPQNEDIYTLSVFFDGTPIKGSPFTIDMSPGVAPVTGAIEQQTVQEEVDYISPDTDKTFIMPDISLEKSGQKNDEKPPDEYTNFVGKALIVRVRPQNDEQKNAPVVAKATGERTGSTELSVTQKQDESYEVTFDPSEPDRYTVDIQINGQPIPRTPFIVNYIMPPSDPSKCKIIGLKDLPSVLEINKEIPLIVDATKAGPGDLEVSADGPSSDLEPSKLVTIPRESEPGMYEVTYIPSSQGTHTLNFLWGGKPIPQSPVRLPVIELATVEVHQYGKPVGLDIEYDCKPTEVRAYALHSDSNYQHKVKVNKVQKGKYTLTFQPKEPGLYYIHIFVKDSEIPASPIVIKYAKPSKPERCKVIGLAETTYVREPLNFTVDVSEAGDGELQVRVLGPAGKDKGIVNVGVKKEDTYTVEYIASSPGKHQLHISWGGKTIPGSPYHLSVRDRTKEQLISWLFLVDRQGTSQPVKLPEEGQNVELHTTTDNSLLLRVKAQTPEQKKGVLTVTATGEQSGSIQIKSTKTSKDTFEALFSPPAPDHYTIEAKLNQEQVPNTPVEVFYTTPPPDPSKCQIIGLESIPPLLQVNKPIPFKVDTRLAGSGKLNIAADGPKAEERPKLQAAASKDEQGMVDVTYTPTAAGTHTLTLTWSGENIPGSPVTFDVSPMLTYAYGQGVEVDMNIECKSGELESYAIHQETTTRYRVKVTKVEKGKFKLTFQPKQQGVYDLHVLIKKKEVPGSPFHLKYDIVSKPESIAVRGLPEIGYVQDPITFVVDTSDAGSGELAIKVISPATKEKKPKLKITDNKDRTYSIGYTPNAPGDHKFDISWSGKSIPGSPFGVDVLQPVSEEVPVIEESATVIPDTLEEASFIPQYLLDELETEEPAQEIGLDVGEGPVKERKPEEYTIMLGRATKLKVRPEAEAGPSESLEVTVSGKNTGAANAKVSKDESGNFEVLFNPTEVDCYTLDMKLKEEPLPRGPFILNYVKPPSHPSKCKILGRENLPEVVVTNEEVYLQVDSREAGYGTLDIKAEAPTLDQNTPKLQAIPSKDTPRMVDVKYTPTAAGIHTLHFQWAKEEIPDSPVSFPVADPSMVVVTEPDKIELLSPAQFQVVTSNAGSGHLTATCEGRKCGEVPVSVIPQEGDRYDVSYIPHVPDTYDLSIKWADREVPNSPFSVTLLPPTPLEVTEPVPEEAPKVVEPVEVAKVAEEESGYIPQDFDDTFDIPSFIMETGEGVFESEEKTPEELTNFVGTALVVKVKPQNEEQRKGQVTAIAIGERTGSTELNVFQKPDDSYDITFNPSEPDRYTVDIQLNDKSIPRTPFIVNYIMPPSDPSKCKIIGLEDLPSVLEVNKEIPLIVDATKAGPGDLEVTADGPPSDIEVSKLAAIAKEDQPGIYEVTYIPSSQGTHTLNFLWGGKPIPQSPVRLPVIELATVEVHQYGKPVGLDIEYDCKPSEVRAYALHSDSNYQHKVKVNKVQKGKYTLTFQPKEPGLYYIHIFVKDSEIPASPIVIRYAKPSKPERCKVIGLAETTYVGEPLTFTVDVSEAGFGELQVRAVGPGGKDKGIVNVGEKKEDTYTVEYIASSPGKHQLHISWAGKTIPGSPYHLSVRDRTKEQLISWLFLVDRQGTSQPAKLPEEGQKVELHTTTDNSLLLRVKAQTPEQKKGVLTVTATGEQSGSIPIKSTKISKDTFEALFSPPAPDHYTIEAKLNQELVPNTPVEVFYTTPPPDPSKCRIIGLESIPPLLQVNKPIPFKVDTRLAGSGKLNIAADGPKAEERPKLQAAASKDVQGIVDVTYTPTAAGTHTLTLTWSGENIPGSPLTFDVSPILTYAYGQGVEVDMNIECKSGELESYAIHQETTTRYRVKVTKVEKGKFKLTFQPKQQGVYDLHVLIKKKEVPGSPFHLRYDIVSKPESIVVRELPDIGYVQDPITFVVDTSDAGSGELVVKVTSPATKEKKPELIITDNKDRTYSIGYTPNAPGDHKFDILWSGESIPGSPFGVDILQPVSEEVPVIEESATVIPDALEEASFIPQYLLDELETEEPAQEIGLDVGKGDVKERKPEEYTIMLGRATKLKVRPEAGAEPSESLEVTVSGKNTGAANAKVSKDESGIFEVLFNPTEVDCYTLDMKLKEEPIPRGPFILNYVKPPSHPSKCRILGRENLPEVVVTNEEVYLQVDSREAGYGTLDIKAEAPTLDQNTPKLQAIPSKDTPRMVDVKYTPTAAGIHTLHFQWAKEEIPDSPVSFPVADPSMVVVTEPDKIELLSTAQFQVVTSYAGSGHLTATCEGRKCGEVPVSAIPQEGDRYDVSYIPLVPDTYDLSIKWADREVPNSPFSVTLLPPTPLQVIEPVPQEVPKVIEPVEAVELVEEESVYTPQDFDDTFEVTLETEKKKEEEVEVGKEKLEEFTNFIGAALVVKVRPQNEEQKKGQVTGTATGEKTGSTELKVLQRPDETYEVTFNPSEPDRYMVDIQLNEKSIPRTPFIVNYIMPPSDPSKCKIIGLEDLPSVLEVNKEIPLIVDATKAGPGDLEVTADGPPSDIEVSKLAAIAKEDQPGIYEVTYIPSSQGTHTLNFLWGGKPIPQSPVRLPVIELATVEVHQYGKPVGLEIEYDCKPSEVRAYALHSDSNYQHKVKVNKVQKGKYTLTFQPKEPGLYYIHIFVKDTEIPASPIVIRYAKPSKPERCKVIGLAETTYVREPLNFTVDVSEAGDGELQVRAVGPAGKDKGIVNVGVKKEDTYTVEYIASSPGKHQLHISWAGKTIPGSPYHLSVRDRTKEQLISWLFLVDRQGTGQPAKLPEEGQKVELHTTTDNSLLLRVKAQTPEQKKGVLTVTATGEQSGSIPIKSTKISKDTFEALFSPPAPDHYTIEAKLNQELVPNTPVEVFYTTPPPDPSKCRIIGLESIPPLLQVNKPIPFKVDTRLAGSGKLNIAADGPKAEERPKLQAAASKDEQGMVDVTYTPTAAGTHTLTLTWSGESIPGSPVTFDVSPMLTYAYGQGVEVDMNIECKSGELESYAIHQETTTRYRVKVTKVEKGKFKLTFQPKQQGVYDLHVLIKKKEVPGSPFHLRYDIVSKPESIVVRGLPDIGYVQDPITFVVDTSDAGSGELVVKVTSPATKEKKPELIITDNKDRTYSISCTPNAPGDHKFDILWSGESIPGSPFGVDVLQPVSEEVPVIEGSATVIPDTLEEASFIPQYLLDELETEEPAQEIGLDVGEGAVKERKPEEYTIMLGRATKLKVRPEAGAEPSESLEVTVSGKNTGAANAKVSKDESGNFEVLFNPTEVDCYTLDMKLKEDPLPRGPFILNYVKPPSHPSKCRILGRENLPEVVVSNEVVYLQVDSREAGYGTLDIKAEAPTLDQNTPKLQAIPSKDTPRMVDVKYTPTAAGIHTLHFQWAKEEIPDSPVSFPVADPSMVVVTEPDKIELLSTAQFQVVTSYAGSGHLTATCEGRKCGEVPVSAIPQEGDRYDVSYIPLVPDTYDLSIKWADREVPNSPFSVTLLPPTPLQVIEPVPQEVPKVIEPVEVAKIAEEESSYIPQDFEDTFDFPSFIMETGEGVFESEEKTPEELTNFVGTALVVKVKPQNEEQRKGQVTAIAIGERTGSTELNVFQKPDDSYDITFNPSEPDRYTVDIQLNDKSIPRTPFIVNYIMPPSDPSKCKIIGLEDLPSVLEVNKEIPLIVDATKAGPGDLEVTADGPPSDIEVSKLAAIAKEDQPGIYEVTYIPSSQGTHTLNFLWGGKPIPQSPVRLPVIELATVEVHQYGKPVGLDIEYDCKPSEVRAYALHSDSNYQHKVKVNKVQKAKYTLTFQPKEPGLYYIHIFVKDTEIPASPIVIRYAKPSKPERCKVIGLAETTYVGEPLNFSVDVSEAGFGELQVRAVGPGGKDKGIVNIGEKKEDTYAVEYIASSSGKHQFHISWAGKIIPGSPYHLSVRDRTKEQLISWLFLVDRQGTSQPAKLPEEGQKVELHTTTDNSLLLRVKAQTPEQKKGVLTVTATGEQSGSIPIKSTKTSKDTFEALFSPPAPDHYIIEAKLNQEQVPNTPVEVFYSSPPPDPSKCRIIGLESLLPLLQVNKPIPFKVDTRFAGSGKLNIAADGPKAEKHPKLQAAASKDESGMVDVTYTPTAAGTHTLTLTWSGETIPGSPLTFDISPIQTYTYGRRVEVHMNIECKSSELESYAIHQETATRYSVKVSKVEKGKFKFTFQPKEPGVYGVHFLIKRREIPGSPFYLRYDTPPKPESITVRGVPDIGYVQDPITFVVDTSDAGSGELAINVTSPATKEKKPELIITDNKDRTYSIGYTPNAPGDHKFDISWSGKSIPGSPFGVDVLQPVSEEIPVIEESATVIPDTLEEASFIPQYLLDELETEEPAQEIGLDVGEGAVKERKPEEYTIMLGRATKLKVRPEAGAEPSESLEVTVSGKNTGAANAKVSKDESGIFEVLFNPTEVDCYTLDMKLKEEPIPRGPFILNYVKPPSHPSKCRILGRENLPEVVVTNEDVYLQVDSREAGYGTLDIKAEAPTLDQNTPKLQAIPSKDTPRMVDVKYTPTAAGIHTLHFQWAKEEIPDSPVSFPVADPSMVVVTEPDKIELLSTAQFQVVTSYAGSGHLTATCEGRKCGEVPVSAIPQEGDRYDVSYVPLVPDTYDLSIKWADREVPNSPFSVTLLPPTPLQVTEPVPQEALKVIEPVEAVELVEEESVYTPQDFDDLFEVTLETEKKKEAEVEKEKLEEFTNFIGAALVVKVRPQNEEQKKGQVTGTATGEKTGSTELKVFQRPDETYEVTFNPSEPDRYTVDIQLNEKSIPRTPFIVNYIMPPSDPSKCKIIGVEDLPSVLEVNKEISLIVDATNAGPGDLEVSADGPSSDLEPSKLAAIPRESEPGMYEVTYIPSSQGTHTLNFLWGGKPIPQSPVRLPVIELATVEVHQYGKPVGLDIEYDCKPSEVRAYALHLDSNYQHKVKVNKVQKGKYTLTFQPKQPGLYYIHIFVKDSEIPASPIVIRYAKPSKPERCKVIGLAETTYVREPLTFTVDVSEAGDGELQVRVVGPAGKDKGIVNIGEKKEDTYTVEYIASSPGKHQLHISWAGKTIPGSPYHLSVRDRTKEQLISWLFLVDCQGTSQPAKLPEEGQKVELHTTTDNSLLLRVKAQTPEQKKGVLTVTATGEQSGSIPIKSTKISKDTFEALFSPPAPDHYTIEAKLNQEQVPNTPVVVFYTTPPPDPSKCRIIGLESIPPLLQVNKPIPFKVDTRLAGSGKLNIAADGPKAEERPKLQAAASKDEQGMVDVTYTPTAAGTHTLTLTWSGENIPGSPLTFDVSPMLTYAYGQGVEVDMNIECKSGELESYAIHQETTTRYRVKVTKVEKGKFKLTFQPKQQGIYDLHVLIKRKEVPGSPFHMRYDIVSKPESIVVHGLPDIGYVQDPITFVVDTSDAGSGELAIKVISPATKEKKPKLKIKDNKDRTYSIGYTP